MPKERAKHERANDDRTPRRDQNHAGGDVLGDFGQRMPLRRGEIDGGFNGGIERFGGKDESDRKCKDCPVLAAHAEPGGQCARGCGDSNFNPGVSLSAEKMPEAFECVAERAAEFYPLDCHVWPGWRITIRSVSLPAAVRRRSIGSVIGSWLSRNVL